MRNRPAPTFERVGTRCGVKSAEFSVVEAHPSCEFKRTWYIRATHAVDATWGDAALRSVSGFRQGGFLESRPRPSGGNIAAVERLATLGEMTARLKLGGDVRQRLPALVDGIARPRTAQAFRVHSGVGR